MALFEKIAIDDLTPSRLWAELDPDTRRLAASAIYDNPWDDASMPAEANAAICAALRFRPIAVRKLPVTKRVEYLARAVRPDDALASSLLRSLHLAHRRELLAAFLDAVGVPQENGVIDGDTEIELPETERLAQAIAGLRGRFPAEEIELYIACLLAMDPEPWARLADVVRLDAG
jgi:hypothetical protein